MTNEVFKELMDPSNWAPNYSEIARKTGKSVSAVHAYCNRRIDNSEIKVEIKEVPVMER